MFDYINKLADILRLVGDHDSAKMLIHLQTLIFNNLAMRYFYDSGRIEEFEE